MTLLVRLGVLWMITLFACGGSPTPAPVAPGAFDPTGLKLVIGVDRTKTIEVKPDGAVVSSETGDTTMKFVGQELRSADASKTLLALKGDELWGPQKKLGAFDGDGALVIIDVRLSADDDGVVHLEHSGSSHKMRMHFEGSVAGRKRPALMLVALVFSLYIATNPNASLDRFVD